MPEHETSVSKYEPVLSYKISDDDSVVETTALERELEPNWCEPSKNNRTLSQSSKLKGHPFSLVAEPTETVTPPVKPQQSQVSGVVLQVVDEMSVKCELYLDPGNVQVQLPRALFPEKILYGQPITLEMVEDNGIRQPHITVRQPDAEKFKELKEEIAAILEEF